MNRAASVFVLCAVSAGPSFGAITATTGAATVTQIPPSLSLGAFESDDAVRVMFERNRNLPEAQEVDITQVGLVDQLSDLTPGLVPAGTAVRSYIFHADSVGVTNRTYEGSVTFAEDILGIIVTSARLQNTDNRFGADGTVYWTNAARGLDLGANPGNETLLLTVSRNTVAFRLVVGEAMDEFRVLTAIPSPGWSGLACGASLGAARRRRTLRQR